MQPFFLCLLLHAGIHQEPVGSLTAEQVMQHVRQATHFDLAKIPASGLLLQGKGSYAGLPAQYSLHFDRAGRYVQTVKARITTGQGFDGKQAWIRDLGGEVRVQELSDERNNKFMGLLMTSLWLDPASGISYKLPEKPVQNDVYTLNFSYNQGAIDGTLHIDAKTWLPVDCQMQREGRQLNVQWLGTLMYEGMLLPKQVQTTSSSDSVESYQYETVQAAPTIVTSPFAVPAMNATDVVFDTSLPAELVVKRAKTGHLLVKPLVNGKDVGWFIFDSGAGAHCLATSTIKELGLEQFGELPAIGVGGAVKTKFSQPDSLQVGRATFQKPIVIGLDFAFLDAHMGEHIAGVLGYGAFHRCIIEIDMERNTIAVFEPKTYDDKRVQGRWQKLYQTSRIACVDAEFEGHRGVFKLDTGAAGSTVALHAPIVEKFKLLDNRITKETMTGGVGGMVKARTGKLKYFELGGHRHEDIEALFITEKTGALNTAETLGNIGGDLVKPFKMVFDYQGKRIAFLKREETNK